VRKQDGPSYAPSGLSRQYRPVHDVDDEIARLERRLAELRMIRASVVKNERPKPDVQQEVETGLLAVPDSQPKDEQSAGSLPSLVPPVEEANDETKTSALESSTDEATMAKDETGEDIHR